MDRTTVIQAIINKKRARSYLEIGVDHGNNFFPIKVSEKTAVDPNFKFGQKKRIKWVFRNPDNLSAKYHKVTSDKYFTTTKLSKPFDVIFIDGLHTYNQSLNDVINALNILAENGIIIMHDCNPPHEAAATPANSMEHATSLNIPKWTGEWCGDVWKTICHLRSLRQDLEIFVLDCDYGLGIIKKGKPSSSLDFTQKDIEEMNYQALANNRETLLNLKNENYFLDFLEKI